MLKCCKQILVNTEGNVAHVLVNDEGNVAHVLDNVDGNVKGNVAHNLC